MQGFKKMTTEYIFTITRSMSSKRFYMFRSVLLYPTRNHISYSDKVIAIMAIHINICLKKTDMKSFLIIIMIMQKNRSKYDIIISCYC